MSLTIQVPQVGVANSTEAVKVTNSLTNLAAWANGAIPGSDLSPSAAIAATQLAASVQQSAGLNGAAIAKGATNIATSESRTNVAYGTLTTPDQVQNVVLPANGLIAVWYQATWQESVLGGSKAAIFLNSNQLKVNTNVSPSAPTVQETASGASSPNVNTPLSSGGGGLLSDGGAAYTGDVTTGQVVGFFGVGGAQPGAGPCYIFAAAGTYTVSVQFKAGVGTVTASNRKLWVQAISFA